MSPIQITKFRFLLILFFAIFPLILNVNIELIQTTLDFSLITAFLLSLAIVLFLRLYPRLMGWFCVVGYYSMIIVAFALLYLHLSHTVQLSRFPFELLFSVVSFSYIASQFRPKLLLHVYIKNKESKENRYFDPNRKSHNSGPFSRLSVYSAKHENTRALSGIPNGLYMTMQHAKNRKKNHEKNDQSIIPKSEND